ncbi:MAG: TatD family hydrolase [Anaerolineales bacterium]
MMRLIDTHCHLFMADYASDIDAVIERAKGYHVHQMIVAGIDARTSQQAVQLADSHKEVYAAVGLHPNSSVNNIEEELKAIHQMLSHPKVVAVGEIGLDYYRDFVPISEQKDRLRRQLEMAEESGLPLILHNRNAIVDLFPIVSEWVQHQRSNNHPTDFRYGVFHSFSETAEIAQQIVALGFLIGISGVITYPNAPKITDVVRAVSLEHLLIETDAPYLCPQPCRGKRNEPANLIYTLQKLSYVLEIAPEAVADATTQNAQLLFGIG